MIINDREIINKSCGDGMSPTQPEVLFGSSPESLPAHITSIPKTKQNVAVQSQQHLSLALSPVRGGSARFSSRAPKPPQDGLSEQSFKDPNATQRPISGTHSL